MELKNKRYKFSDFLPLIVIFSIILSLTLIYQLYYGFSFDSAMRIFMALFFLIFGAFKVAKLREFAQAYSTYDLIAKKFLLYGYVYPFLELGLGLSYLLKINPFLTNISTLVLMLISAVGVFIELQKGKMIVCACLGTVFKIPMTYVTLSEDLIMALMALIMLLK